MSNEDYDLGSLCDGTPDEIKAFMVKFESINCIVLFVFVGLCAVASLTATYYIFCNKNTEQRPLFVTLQMIFLNLFWLTMVGYFASMGTHTLRNHDPVSEQTKTENIIAALGDFWFIIHDWIFTEQYLSASLMMPAAIKMFEQEGSLKVNFEREKKKALVWIRLLNVTFYLLTISWLIVTSITGNFLWRMAISMVFLFVTIVFLKSLCSIRRLLKHKNLDKSQF